MVRARLATERQACDPIERLPTASAAQKEWLRRHRDVLDDPRRLAHLGAAHHDALAEGNAADSPEYFSFLERRLGYRSDVPGALPFDPMDSVSKPTAPARRVMVSAPVSRSASASGGADLTAMRGRVELTPQEREAAKISGVTEREYAQQKVRLMLAKRDGQYPGAA